MVWTAWACLSDEPDKPEIKRSSWATNKACQAVSVCCHHIPCDEAFPRHVAGSGLRASAWSVTSYDSKIVKKKRQTSRKYQHSYLRVSASLFFPVFRSVCLTWTQLLESGSDAINRFWPGEQPNDDHLPPRQDFGAQSRPNSLVIKVYVYMSLHFVYI